VQRSEWPQPGGLLHLDITSLGGIGCVGHRIPWRSAAGHPGDRWPLVPIVMFIRVTRFSDAGGHHRMCTSC